MKINLSDIPKVCHCNASFLDHEALTTLEDGYQRLRRSEASTPLRTHLSIKVYKLLKYQSTQLGASLLDVVRLGLLRHNSPTGAVLPDQYAYDTFKLLLDPLLEKLHLGFDPYTDTQPPVNWGDWRRLNDLDPEGKFIQRVCVSASRNLNGFRFTPTMTRRELCSVEDAVVLSLMKLPGEYAGNYDYIQCMDAARKKELSSAGCLFHCGEKNDHAAKVPNLWSYGRGVYANYENTFAVWVNAKDHVRVISQAEGGQLQDAYRRLAEVMPYLDCRLRPARHPRLGQLTVSLDDVGSGVSVAADVVLRAMPNPLLDKIAKVYRLEIRCLEGNLYQVSKHSHLGYTEYEVVKDFNHGLRELLCMASFLEGKSQDLSLIRKEEKKDEMGREDDRGSGDHLKAKKLKPEKEKDYEVGIEEVDEPKTEKDRKEKGERQRREHEEESERERREQEGERKRRRELKGKHKRLEEEEESKRQRHEQEEERERPDLERKEEQKPERPDKEKLTKRERLEREIERKRQRLKEEEERKRRRLDQEEERQRQHLERKEERKRKHLEHEEERKRKHLEHEAERKRKKHERKEKHRQRRVRHEEEHKRRKLERKEKHEQRRLKHEKEHQRKQREHEEKRERRHELKEESKRQRLEQKEEVKRRKREHEEERERKRLEHEEGLKRKKREKEEQRERQRREKEEERKRRHDLKEESKQQRLEEKEERKRQQHEKEEERKRRKREHKEKHERRRREHEEERQRRKREHKEKHERRRHEHEEERQRRKREHKEKHERRRLEHEDEQQRKHREQEDKRKRRRELEKAEKEELQRRYAREKEEREMMYARLRRKMAGDKRKNQDGSHRHRNNANDSNVGKRRHHRADHAEQRRWDRKQRRHYRRR